MYLNPKDDRGHDSELSLSGYAFHQYATVGIVPEYGDDAITSLSMPLHTQTAVYYDLQGCPVGTVADPPTRKGVYIFQGRKVVII